jgi:membrane protease YdiL (CAAX protease family)
VDEDVPAKSLAPAGSRLRPTWGIVEILTGIAGALILLFVISLVVVLPASELSGSESQATRAATGLSNALWNLGMIYVVYFLIRRSGSGWREAGIRRPGDSPQPLPRRKRLAGLTLPWTVWCVLGGLIACYSVLYTYSGIISLFGLDWLEPGKQIADDYFESPWLVAAIGIPVVITAPIAEEVFFRGLVFGGLQRYVPFAAAALISGVIFAIPHLDFGLIIPFTLIGAILANTYKSSGTLFASMAVHFIFNLLSFMILVLVPDVR